MARLNANGSLDGSFTAETDDTITAIAVQTNGAILVGGFFAQAIHTPRIGIARLGVDGVLDATFNPVLGGNPFSTVFALAVQGDGKILVGGSFTSVNGTPTANLARLNVNGTVDGTFKPVSIAGGQLSSAIYALAVATVQATLGIEPGQISARRAAHAGEAAAQEHFAAGLQRDRIHIGEGLSCAWIWIKSGVPTAVAVESGHIRARRAVESGEIAADENLAIRLHRDGIHQRIDPCARIEAEVHGAGLGGE